jgi:ABC-type antimicrobial peptide transport system permease subunit
MRNVAVRLLSAWQLIAKQSLAHWKLLSAVAVSALLASAVLSSTVVYYEALRDLALRHTLSQREPESLDVIFRAELGSATEADYRAFANVMREVTGPELDWLISSRGRAGRSPTFFVTEPPLDHPESDLRRAFFAYLERREEFTTMLPGGSEPANRATRGEDGGLLVEALLPEEAARNAGIVQGDQLAVAPSWNDDAPPIIVVVTGIVRRNTDAAAIWHFEDEVFQVPVGSRFVNLPFYVAETVFLTDIGPTLPRMRGRYGWLLDVDVGGLSARNVEQTLGAVRQMSARPTALALSYSLSTNLDETLEEFRTRVFFNRTAMSVVLFLIALVVLYCVALLASLVVEDRQSAVALLRSRGAGLSHVLTVFILEGGTIALLCALAAPPIASLVVRLMGLTPIFSSITDGTMLNVHISPAAWGLSLLGGLLGTTALVFSAARTARLSVTRQRVEAARPETQPLFQRYYVDVLLLVVGIILFRQIAQHGSLLASSLLGEVVVSQFLLVMPGIILAALAMVLLRLLPLGLRVASRVISPGLPVGPVLGLWYMARRPGHYSRLALLLILTAALGMFAASFGATLDKSFEERVRHAVGSDFRINRLSGRAASEPALAVAEYQTVPGVSHVSPVLRTSGSDALTPSRGRFTLLAVDADRFADVGWFRDDYADKPLTELLAPLRVSRSTGGIELPFHTETLRLTVKPERPMPDVEVVVRVLDRQKSSHTITLGRLDNADWTVLEASIQNDHDGFRPPSLPWTLLSITLHGKGETIDAGSLTIDDIGVVLDSGDEVVVEDFKSIKGWQTLKPRPNGLLDAVRTSNESTSGDDLSARHVWAEGTTADRRGMIFLGDFTSQRLPVVASDSFLRATGHAVGDELEVTVGQARKPLVIVDSAALFPTITSLDARFLIADVYSLNRVVSTSQFGGTSDFSGANAAAGMSAMRSITTSLGANELWVSTTSTGERLDALRDRLATSAGFSLMDTSKLLGESQADPMTRAGWAALLVMAFAAVLVVSCLGIVVNAYVSYRDRQGQMALLRTVGMSTRQLTAMIVIEQVLVIVMSMALGAWMGGRLGAAVMPFLGYDDFGRQVMPPFVLEVDIVSVLATYAAMIAILVAVVAALVAIVRRLSLQDVMRLGER